MTWEIKKRKDGKTLWQGKDAEGRNIYALTADFHGVAVEPNPGQGLYSRKAAVEAALEDKRAENHNRGGLK